MSYDPNAKTIHPRGTFLKRPPKPGELEEIELADQPPQQSDARACVSPGCPGCGRYGCPYSPPKTLEEARKVESLGGSPSCLTWPPRPPILDE